MPADRQRYAWLGLCALLAAVVLRVPTGATPTDDELDFVRTMVEVKREVDRRYVRDVPERDLRESAVAGMMATLDRYSQYVPPRDALAFNQAIAGRYEGVGILVGRDGDAGGGLRVIRPIDGGPAQAAGVEAGDRIVAVDSSDVTALEQTAIIDKIKGPVGTPVTLTVERAVDDEIEEVKLTMDRAEVASPAVDGYTRDAAGRPTFFVLGDDGEPTPVKIGYVRLLGFTPDSAKVVLGKFNELIDAGARGLILDMRANPGGLLDEATAIADALLPAGAVIFSARGAHYPERTVVAGDGPKLADVPLAVLVDGQSASASEVLAGALGDHGRAVVVGTRSWGKGSVQQVTPLSDGGEVKLTQAFYYLPSGRLVHREDGPGGVDPDGDWGVLPDLTVEIDPADPAALGDLEKGPPFPAQVRAAYDAVVALVAARDGSPATRPVP